MNNASRATEPKPSFSIVRILLVVIPVLLIAGAWYVASASKSANQGTDSRLLEKMGFKPTAAQRLDSRFSDANGDLVADAPTDASQQVSPDKLIFSYIGGPDAVEEKDAWQSFAKHLSQQIGKPVEIKSFADTEEQLAALKNGELHITGFNTGAVPTAVNAFGFVPVCVPGRRDSDFGYTMKFIVPAASNVATLADLKGKKITFVDLNSHSGYKAAIIELKKIGLLPDRDYQWGFSTSHD
jgi:phosphonate transport system substrate-binding protein